MTTPVGQIGLSDVNAKLGLSPTALITMNASEITTGSLANARTSASSSNGASTIVARDASGNFAGNVITATNVNASSRLI